MEQGFIRNVEENRAGFEKLQSMMESCVGVVIDSQNFQSLQDQLVLFVNPGNEEITVKEITVGDRLHHTL
jgi:hypothetical protein